MEQLKKIIREISSPKKENILDEVKNALQEKDSVAYSKWKEDGFNVNRLFYGEDSLLHLAAENNSIEMVETLIKNGADVNAVDHFGATPLHHAADFGEKEVMKVLLGNGAHVNAVDDFGNTPLHTAVSDAPNCLKIAIVKILIENGADINAVGLSGWTPLHLIATLGDCVDTLKILIKNGASINAVDFYGNTPLHSASRYSSLEMAQALLENGGDPNAKNKYDEDTPLHLAAQNNHLELVKYLVDKGADIYATNNKRKVPLDCAREKGYEKMVEYLTDTMAKMPRNKDTVWQASLKECGCSIQSHQRQRNKNTFHYLPRVEIKPVRQGLYLPSFEGRGVKIDGKCVAITRCLSQALFLHGNKSCLDNLETAVEIYERIAQGKQVSEREERETFAFSELLDSFEQQLGCATNSLPSSLIHNKGYKTIGDLSDYIAGIRGDFAIHLVTSNHVVAIYRTGDSYSYFDCNAAFVSGLKRVDQLLRVVEETVKSASYEVGGNGFLAEHFNVEQANELLSSEDKQVLTKGIKTENHLLAEQDKEFGLIKINGQELSRVQLYDFGTKINVVGSVPLLINAEMKLTSKKFQDHLDRKEVSMTAREYFDHLKDSQNIHKVIQATKTIPFVGSKREIEEAKTIFIGAVC